jgi:hypothetical protein
MMFFQRHLIADDLLASNLSSHYGLQDLGLRPEEKFDSAQQDGQAVLMGRSSDGRASPHPR